MARSSARWGPVGWLCVLLAVALPVVGIVVVVRRVERRPRVLLVGDSITSLSQPELTARLRGRYRVEVSGAPRRTTQERVRDLPLLLTTKPERLVINLGTNDVLRGESTKGTLAALERIGTAFPTVHCVVLVTVNHNMFSAKQVRVGPDAYALDRGIRALAARRHWGVVPWDSIVQRYLDAGQQQGSLSDDTVHPRPVGRRLLADAYRTALDRC